jgi:hypothetical protein
MHPSSGKAPLLPTHCFFALLLSACGAGAATNGGGGGGGPLTITVSGNGTTLEAGQRVEIIATVLNSGGNPAVTWALTGATCPTNCGFLTNTTADTTTYVAPQYLPANTLVTVTATAVADPTQSASATLHLVKSISVGCPSGVDGLLFGSYAFFLRGGGASDSFVAAGSFVADGGGNITSGLYDVNRSATGPSLGRTISGGSSLYSVGIDRRACIAFMDSAGETLFLRCALSTLDSGVATRGRIIEFDDLYGTGTRAEGFLARQDPASFSTAQITGSYAFGIAGTDFGGGRFASAGVFDASSGVLSNGDLDTNDLGAVTADVSGIAGTYSVSPNGRGTLVMSTTSPASFVLYMISTGRFVVAGSDPLDGNHPLAGGEFLLQAAVAFDQTTLNAAGVLSMTGFDPNPNAPTAAIGLFTPDGLGNCLMVLDSNDAGGFAPLDTTAGTYTTATNGRTTTAALGPPSPVFYLVGANEGFCLGTDTWVSFGRLEPQTGGPFTNGSLLGTFDYGTEGAAAGSRVTSVGSDLFDGISTDQSVEDDSTPVGLFTDQILVSQSYSFPASSVPTGRGFLDAQGLSLAYIVSPTRLVVIQTTDSRPMLVMSLMMTFARWYAGAALPANRTVRGGTSSFGSYSSGNCNRSRMNSRSRWTDLVLTSSCNASAVAFG